MDVGVAWMLLWIVPFSLLGSVGVVAGAALFMLFPRRVRQGLLPCLVSYATGTLLAAATLAMLPAALAQAPAGPVMGTVLAGLVLFFLLEKMLLWRHAHGRNADARSPAGTLILVGDAFHNFVDGVVIAAAFLTAIPLGVATSLAVIAHEVPQEVGDFAILLESGYSRRRALLLNAASATATVPGALAGFHGLGESRGAVPYMLAISAASFVYIAMADLIPGLHRQVSAKASLRQLLLLLAGITTIALLRAALH